MEKRYTREVDNRILKKLEKFDFPKVFLDIPIPIEWERQKGILSEMKNPAARLSGYQGFPLFLGYDTSHSLNTGSRCKAVGVPTQIE